MFLISKLLLSLPFTAATAPLVAVMYLSGSLSFNKISFSTPFSSFKISTGIKARISFKTTIPPPPTTTITSTGNLDLM